MTSITCVALISDPLASADDLRVPLPARAPSGAPPNKRLKLAARVGD